MPCVRVIKAHARLVNWGEPERAPHGRDERSKSVYYYWGEPERGT